MRNCRYDHQISRIRCPFFRGHTSRDIGCEGLSEETSIRLIFPGKSARDRHEEIFCINRFENCELYRAILEKYEED